MVNVYMLIRIFGCVLCIETVGIIEVKTYVLIVNGFIIFFYNFFSFHNISYVIIFLNNFQLAI